MSRKVASITALSTDVDNLMAASFNDNRNTPSFARLNSQQSITSSQSQKTATSHLEQ